LGNYFFGGVLVAVEDAQYMSEDCGKTRIIKEINK
jgi:hypothetical protein